MAELRAAREAKKERYKSAARDQGDNKSRSRKPAAEDQEQARPSLKKERVKSTARQNEESKGDQAGRTPRHQPGAEDGESPTPDLARRPKSKSVKRGGEDVVIENKLNADEAVGQKQIFGFGGEMALATATSKKAQQRLKKKMKKEADEEEANQAKI